LELYHNNMSVCAQKVRLVIHEKKLSPKLHHMTLRDGDVHRPEYLKLNPKGVVPTLVDNGRVIIESTVICEYLEDAYPENPLLPADAFGRAKVRQWTLIPDASLHNATGILSVAIAFREQMQAAGGAQLSNRPNFGDSNDQLKNSIEKGVDYERLPAAIKVYDAIIEKIARALDGGSPWLCGDMYTLADVSMLPYVCRLEDLAMSWFWTQRGDRLVVSEWLERAKTRTNYSGISDYRVPPYLALCEEKGRAASPRIKKMLSD